MRTPPAEVWVNVWCTDNDNHRQVGVSFCEPIFVNEEDVRDFTGAVEDMLPGLEEFPSLTLDREARAQSSTPREAVYEELAADSLMLRFPRRLLRLWQHLPCFTGPNCRHRLCQDSLLR